MLSLTVMRDFIPVVPFHLRTDATLMVKKIKKGYRTAGMTCVVLKIQSINVYALALLLPRAAAAAAATATATATATTTFHYDGG